MTENIMEHMEKYQNKARGMLVGLAVGDALGAPVEFGYSSDSIRKLGETIAHFSDTPRCPAGVWTDDTEMALCIADSLIENKGYDSYDIMRRFRAWSEEGYRTYDGKPASDVGGQTARAINDFVRYPVIWRDDPKTDSAGNGSIMRLAPIVIANTFPRKHYPTLKDGYEKGSLATDPEDENGEYVNQNDIDPTLKMAELSCRETHDSVAACAVTEMFAACLYCALHGLKKNDIAAYCSRWMLDEEYDQFWLENIDSLVGRALEPDDDQLCDLGGYIVDCFAISLWGLMNYNNFKDGMMAVIRLGGDTDTNAACYGQLAGAYYGYDAIPEEWRENVFHADELVEIADKLLKMPSCPVIQTRFEDDKNFKEQYNHE